MSQNLYVKESDPVLEEFKDHLVMDSAQRQARRIERQSVPSPLKGIGSPTKANIEDMKRNSAYLASALESTYPELYSQAAGYRTQGPASPQREARVAPRNHRAWLVERNKKKKRPPPGSDLDEWYASYMGYIPGAATPADAYYNYGPGSPEKPTSEPGFFASEEVAEAVAAGRFVPPGAFSNRYAGANPYGPFDTAGFASFGHMRGSAQKKFTREEESMYLRNIDKGLISTDAVAAQVAHDASIRAAQRELRRGPKPPKGTPIVSFSVQAALAKARASME